MYTTPLYYTGALYNFSYTVLTNHARALPPEGADEMLEFAKGESLLAPAYVLGCGTKTKPPYKGKKPGFKFDSKLFFIRFEIMKPGALSSRGSMGHPCANPPPHLGACAPARELG